MTTQAWPDVLMYTTSWCGDCRRSKALLDRMGVPYDEVNIEQDTAAAAEVQRLNNGRRSVPTIVINDGQTVLTEPSDRDLKTAIEEAMAVSG